MAIFSKKWYVLCDEFSWFGWQYEGARRVLGPDASREKWERLIQCPPKARFFLIESVWQNFYGSGCASEDQLPRLIKSLKNAKIPIVFWNKEDPVHFERFLPFALEANLLMTSDVDCIPKYLAAGFKGSIKCLPFPVQPKIHRVYHRKEVSKRVFFAGRYTEQHAQRVTSYENFLKPALQTGLVDVYARKTQFVDESSWPEEAQPYIVGSLEYKDLIKEYTKYSMGLSISSVHDSLSMFPRRVIEMTMGDILVISDRNEAVRYLFPELPQAKTAEEVVRLIHYFLENEKERKDIIKKTKKRILAAHTYKKAYKSIDKNIKKACLS